MDSELISLQCPIDLEYYEDPRLIACGHTFCLECVKGLQKNKVITCPSCRREQEIDDITTLPVNYSVMQAIDEYRKQHPKDSEEYKKNHNPSIGEGISMIDDQTQPNRQTSGPSKLHLCCGRLYNFLKFEAPSVKLSALTFIWFLYFSSIS